jgi:hypothetical protein
LVLLGLLLFLSVSLMRIAREEGPPPTREVLTKEDRTFLDGMLKDFLFDPTGAQRVVVKARARTLAGTVDMRREGWLVPARGGRPARVHFTDGEWIPAPEELLRVDFVAFCKLRLDPGVEPPREEGPREEGGVGIVYQSDLVRAYHETVVQDPDEVCAAWLYLLGHEELAAKLLAHGRQQEKDLITLRDDLAARAFAGFIQAFEESADTEALAHGERLLRLYPGETASAYPQARLIIEDLKRRRKKGTFGRAPRNLPAGMERWEVNKKIAHLIDALEDVNSQEGMSLGALDPRAEPRMAALLAIGEAAVPALADSIATDRRLTRAVDYGIHPGEEGRFIAVREAALTAVRWIQNRW